MSFPIVNGDEVYMKPPDNYYVDFENPTKDTAAIYSSYWAFGVGFLVACCFLAQRVYTASFILRRWRSDDYMIMIAWLLITVAQCLIIRCLTQGVLGVHIWEMPLYDAVWETKIIHATTLTVIPGTVLAKLVLCIFYYRLWPLTWYRYAVIFTAVTTTVTFAAVWFSVEFACRPVEAAWNLRTATATCIDRPPVYMLQAVMGGVTDIMLMVLPIPTIFRLRMSSKQKWALMAWFGTGLITLGAALGRLIVLVPSLHDPDTTFVLANGTLWLIIEANLIIICGSLPTLRIFLNHISPRILGETYSSSSGGHSDNEGKHVRPGGMRYALRTFGSSQNKRGAIDSIAELELGTTSLRARKGSRFESGTELPARHEGFQSRSGSEEAIIKTPEAAITSSGGR